MDMTSIVFLVLIVIAVEAFRIICKQWHRYADSPDAVCRNYGADSSNSLSIPTDSDADDSVVYKVTIYDQENKAVRKWSDVDEIEYNFNNRFADMTLKNGKTVNVSWGANDRFIIEE